MGNCVCASSGVIAPKIRVVQASERRVVDVELPPLQACMTVGELLLEFPPGHFVTQLKPESSASTGRKRATPLGADVDAKPGAVYVLFPMPRMHTRITPQELLSIEKLLHLQDQQLTYAAHNPSKKAHVHGLFAAGARVAPLTDEECKDGHFHRDADTHEQAVCPLLISFRRQANVQESMFYADSSMSCISSSCHGHMGLHNKPKPWAPKLQTIMESS